MPSSRRGTISRRTSTIDTHDIIRSTNTVSLTPGLRTHLGQNCHFLGAVEVPVAHVKGFDYQVLGGHHKGVLNPHAV